VNARANSPWTLAATNPRIANEIATHSSMSVLRRCL
jgi:hypothetical protein